MDEKQSYARCKADMSDHGAQPCSAPQNRPTGQETGATPILASSVTSKTPRTDRKCEWGDGDVKYEVSASFARQLELECAEWRRVAVRLGELWEAYIRLAKQHGDVGFIPEQEAVAELRRLLSKSRQAGKME